MKKRLTAGVLATALALSGCSAQVENEIEPMTDITEEELLGALAATGSVNPEKRFLIFCWNEEFKSYFGDIVDEICSKQGKEAEYFILNAGEYSENLLDAFKGNSSYYNAPDLVLLEPEYIQDCFPYITDVKELGISENDTAQMYEYTKQIGTDEKGALKALSWAASSGVFAYRRSIARAFRGRQPRNRKRSGKGLGKLRENSEKGSGEGLLYYCLNHRNPQSLYRQQERDLD